MTYIDIEFQSVPMSIGQDGWVYGDDHKVVADISFTAVIEATTREKWSVDEILLWERGSTRVRPVHYGLDRASQLFRDLKHWLETDTRARDKIADYVALEILPSGRLVSSDAGPPGEARV